MPGRYGQVQRYVSRTGIATYQVEVWHEELTKHRTIKASTPEVVAAMVQSQLEIWDLQWQGRQHAEQARAAREAERDARTNLKIYQEDQKLEAASLTEEASDAQDELANILADTLDRSDVVDWESLRDASDFPEPPPQTPPLPPPPRPREIPREPLRADELFTPRLTLLDQLLPGRKQQRQAEMDQYFEGEHARWRGQKASVLSFNAAQAKEHADQVARLRSEHAAATAKWEQERSEFLEHQRQNNAAIDEQKARYLSGDPESVATYCDMVLSLSPYPDFMPNEWEIDYNPETRTIVVDYRLPAPEDIPTLVEVRYVASRDEMSEKHLNAAQRDKVYDELLYQIVLRTVHELFEADVVDALECVTFNGLVLSIDRSTGKEVTTCVLSLQAKRDEFTSINLARVDPKACFRQLKGVGSSKLHSVTAVAPIMQIRREDGRFVAAYDVAHQLDEGYNLATMGWEDFEHLIREVFAKEFSASGGEVKVTQASRDGGVDAVAFDPDPIRGGKIVIQAKRYTNTVGVSAVRDLYGTVMNEGATKGILVTTSDYGPDAYEFAKGKPLTLLSGANLLHLLEKHGHQARIDLAQARRDMTQQRRVE